MGTVLSSIPGKVSLYDLVAIWFDLVSRFDKGVSMHFYAFRIPMLSFKTLLCPGSVSRCTNAVALSSTADDNLCMIIYWC